MDQDIESDNDMIYNSQRIIQTCLKNMLDIR